MDPQTAKIIESYSEILGKTNQQLSLWSNPYGIAMGILSLLVGLLAIGVGIALWKNSKDQKELVERFFSDQEKIIQERNAGMKKVQGGYEKLIKAYEDRLEKATSSNKKELQKAIDDIRKEMIGVGSKIGPATTWSPTIGFSNQGPYSFTGFSSTGNAAVLPLWTLCPNCHRSFTGNSSFSTTVVNKCPYCEAVI